MTETVVITGASAGIGRAAAELFGRRGDNVVLIARGEDGLQGAARAVEEAGGSALAISADVADFDAVDRAATQAEEAFGPIDVWVNVAFTSVFAPFWEIKPDEFKRVTEVSYLGYVHGTMAALARMRPRDRGTIVQVGSALGYRAIPLQSAYCGAKHAINGFTESVRTELMHEGSHVKITIVQMPAVNTPQFSWVLSRLPRQPQPVPPIYQPEVAAQGVVFAADHADRKEHWVGASTAGTIMAQKFAAPVLDRYLARTGFDSQQTSERAVPGRPSNLWQPVDQPPGSDEGAHGVFDNRSHARSAQLTVTERVEEAGAIVRRALESLVGAARSRPPQHPWSAATAPTDTDELATGGPAPAPDAAAPSTDTPTSDADIQTTTNTPTSDADIQTTTNTPTLDGDMQTTDAASPADHADAPTSDAGAPTVDHDANLEAHEDPRPGHEDSLADPDTAVVDHDTSVPDIDASLPEPDGASALDDDAANRHSFLDDIGTPLADQDAWAGDQDAPVTDEDAAWTNGGVVPPTQVDVPPGHGADLPGAEGAAAPATGGAVPATDGASLEHDGPTIERVSPPVDESAPEPVGEPDQA